MACKTKPGKAMPKPAPKKGGKKQMKVKIFKILINVKDKLSSNQKIY